MSRRWKKFTAVFALTHLVFVPVHGRALVAPTSQGGVLKILDTANEEGTRAIRTFRDNAGRTTREIHYSGPISGPVAEEQLLVQSVVIFRYRANGLLQIRETRGPDQVLQKVQQFEYDVDGRLRQQVVIGPRGAKESETWYHERDRETFYQFDKTGRRIVSAHGPIRSDRDLTNGWGAATKGVALALGLTASVGEMADFAAWVSFRNTNTHEVTLAAPTITMLITNAKGVRIRQEPPAQGRKLSENGPREVVLHAGYSQWSRSPYFLTDRFSPLALGTYSLQITISSPGLILESNAVTFVIR